MNLSYYIATKFIGQKDLKNSISGPIIKIAIAAIALGLLMMLVAIATSLGLKTKIREKIAAFNGHIQITNFDHNQSDVSTAPVSTDQDFYPKFQSVEGVNHIQAVAVKAGILRTENTFEGILAKGIGSDFNQAVFREFLIDGHFLQLGKNISNQIVLSKYLANRLQLNLGDEVRSIFLKENDATQPPNNRKFTVVGLYDTGFEEFDKSYVFIDIQHIQRMNKWQPNQVGHFEVFLNDFDAMDAKTEEIYTKTVSVLNTKNLKDKYYTIFEWLSLFDINVVIIISIMILVGGINMITALLVLILERTPMIGTLKSLGADDWSIRKVFLINAAYLIGWGLLLGNLIGVGIILLQQKFGFLKFPNPEQYYVSIIPVQISWIDLVLLNAGVMILCLIMLLLPSYAISRISPIRAIKFR